MPVAELLEPGVASATVPPLGSEATLAVPNCIYATSASLGRFGLQAWLAPQRA
jgi:hypothetical protein